MAATVWKGYISFGLISVPIRLYTAARSEHVSFHEVHSVCNTRIKQQLYCPSCERVVERSELVKGYEVEKGRFVTVTDDEVKKIAPPSSDTMEITEFVKTSEIDPLYYESSYYALPEKAGAKPYQLLVSTMEKTGYAALAKVGMHRREYIVVIRPREHGLTLHTMFYPNEVREVPGYGAQDKAKLDGREIALAEQLIKSLAAPFQPEKYEDEYQKRLLELVEAKAEGKTLKGEHKPRKAQVIDLMQALKKSLAEKPTAKRPAAAKATAHAHARKRARAS